MRGQSIALFASLIAVIGVFYVTHSKNGDLQRTAEAIEHGGVLWDDDVALPLFEAADTAYVEAAEALSRGEFNNARDIRSDRAIAPIRKYVREYGAKLLPSGSPALAWFDTRELEYKDALEEAFRQLLDQLATGGASPDSVRTIIDDYPRNQKLEGIYDARFKNIASKREVNALRWCRVIVEDDGNIAPLRSMVESTFRGKWDPKSKLHLVFGNAMTELEAQVTPLTLTCNVHIDYASYRIGRASSFSRIDWEPPEIPGFAKLKFRMDNKTRPTSWDSIELVEALFKPPTLISKTTSDLFIRTYHEAIVKELREKLSQVPTFEFTQKGASH